MRVLKKSDVLRQSDLKEELFCHRIFDMKEKHPSYILEIKKKKYLVRREGKCDYKKCKNACCKFTSHNCGGKYSDGELVNTYVKGFSDRILGDHAIMKNRCSRLNRDGSCKLWKRKGFPGPCKEFPHPFDGVYIAVAPVCSFKFIIDGVFE